jgi:hypothetical protein
VQRYARGGGFIVPQLVFVPPRVGSAAFRSPAPRQHTPHHTHSLHIRAPSPAHNSSRTPYSEAHAHALNPCAHAWSSPRRCARLHKHIGSPARSHAPVRSCVAVCADARLGTARCTPALAAPSGYARYRAAPSARAHMCPRVALSTSCPAAVQVRVCARVLCARTFARCRRRPSASARLRRRRWQPASAHWCGVLFGSLA